MNAKILFITLLLLSISNIIQAQLFSCNLQKIVKKNKKLAKRDLMFKEGTGLDDIIYLNIPYAKQLEYLPVSSFVLSKKTSIYDSTSKIIDFLVLNNHQTLQEYYTFKNGKYEGVKSLFNDVYFNSKGFRSSYDSSKIFEPNNYNTIMYNTLNILKKYKFDFLFAVKYFRNAIWFIENKQVYLIDMKDLKIYDPDEYIRLKCSVEIVRELAQGKVDKFCD